MKYLSYFIISLLILSCHPHDHSHEDHGQSMEDNSGDHKDLSFTRWTEDLEIFVVHPPLESDSQVKMTIHLTELEGHRPLPPQKVALKILLNSEELKSLNVEMKSAGIAELDLPALAEGNYELGLHLGDEPSAEIIELGEIVVGESREPQEAAISFLKEQAWGIDFQTDMVDSGLVYHSVSSSGLWKNSPKDIVGLNAGTDGNVTFAKPLTEGLSVRKGELLVTIENQQISGDNLIAQRKEAKAKLEQAESSFERKRQLHEKQIISSSEFEKSKRDLMVFRAQYEALMKGASGEKTNIYAPTNGLIESVLTENGSFVVSGDALLRLTGLNGRLLEAKYSPQDSYKDKVADIWYKTGDNKWLLLSEAGGNILSEGFSVDASHPLIPVYAEIQSDPEMPIGSFTEVELLFGNGKSVLCVPESALLEDYGAYSVIIQNGGESFEKRSVKIGKRNGKLVEIKQGLSHGEHIVTEGAYAVKMASLSGQTPEHSHSH